MFGLRQREHEERYAMSHEWIDVAKRLWTEDTFDYDGKFFSGPALHSEPKPVQLPHPVLMSAGASPIGRDFAAKHTDINFIVLPTLDGAKERINEIREYARVTYAKDIKVMSMGYVVCRETEREAQDYLNYYVHERGDWTAVSKMVSGLVVNSKSADYSTNTMAINLIGGYSALPLVGTPAQVVQGMVDMYEAGLDGITLSWVNYGEGLAQYEADLLPLLRQAGLRA